MKNIQVLLCLALVCLPFFVKGGIPFPFPVDVCDSNYGILRSFTVNATTYIGSNYIVNLGYRGPFVGFFEFNLTGSCVGVSYLPGANPVVALIRKDGVPWDRNYNARLTLYERFFEWDPSYTPYVVSFFGYEGRCNVELNAQYCECLPGQVGPGCRHNHTHFNQEVVIAPRSWNYHCIHQNGSTLEVVRNYTVQLQVPQNQTSELLLRGRWGAPPVFEERTEAILIPPAENVWMNISYPRFETNIFNETCYFVGVFNPTNTNASYTLTHDTHICNGTYGDNCDIVIQHANFSDQITALIHTNQFYVAEFLPHSLYPLRHPRYYEFTLSSSEPDLDLFVRRDGPPTLTEYDYYNNETTQNRTIRVYFPLYGPQQNSKWFAGVYRVQGDTVLYFTLEARAVFCDECIPGNGVCANLNESYPYCQCGPNYAGRGCGTGITSLGQSQRQNFNLNAAATNYHKFTVPSFGQYQAVLNVYISLISGGQTEFYLRHNAIPTSYDYHYRSGLTNLTFAITRPNLVAGDTWYISAMNYGTASSYSTYVVLEEETVIPTTASSSLTSSTTTTGAVTTGSNTVVVPVYKNNPGAMAGLAFGMLFTGALIGVGGLWFMRRRGYAPLSQL